MTHMELSDTVWWPDRSEQDERAAAEHVERLTEQARSFGVRPPDDAVYGRVPASDRLSLVGICGAGVMGTGIAVANLRNRVRVKLYDASAESLQRACEVLQREFTQTTLPGQFGQWVEICATHQPLGDCDLLIECVAENRELKQRVLQQLAARVTQPAVCVTNTSTIRLAELAASVSDPGRFAGLHFCNPIPLRPLVEIVRTDRTSAATIGRLLDYVSRIGKLPIIVRDSPGFLVNRLLLPYLNEALEMLCQGTDLRTIDDVGRRFGMELGPFEMLDMIGVDTAMRAGRTLWEAFPDRIALTPILPRLVKLGRLGQKTGVGFYRYPAADGRGQFDPDLPQILAPYVRRLGSPDATQIAARLVLPMLLEAARALEEGVVQHARDVDLGVLFGLAFPRVRGGLLYWADQVGAARILEMLQPLQATGSRMAAPPWLQTMAATGGRFFEEPMRPPANRDA